PRQARAAALIHAFDVWSQVEVRDRGQLRPAGSSLPPTAESQAAQTTAASSTPSDPTAQRGLELTTHDGLALPGYSLFVYVARRLRLLWPLALLTWVPGMATLGRAWYPSAHAALPATEGKPTWRSGGDERSTSPQAVPKDGVAS